MAGVLVPGSREGLGGAMPYHWAHFSANSACLRAIKAPSAVMLPVAISLAIQLWRVQSVAGNYCKVLGQGTPLLPPLNALPFSKMCLCILFRL